MLPSHIQNSAIYKKNQISYIPTYSHTLINNAIDQLYRAIESRIIEAINAINTRKNTKIAKIAREFDVPYDRLRNRLYGIPSASAVRGLYNRRLTDNQEKALQLFY